MYFAGSDGIDDTKGIIDEDKPIKLVVLDELTEFFDDGEGEDELTNIEATFVRGNKGGFQMIYLYNPPKNPNAPINLWCKKMEKREDCIHIHTDYRDVPVDWLGPDLIASAEMMKKADPKMYRWVWLGEAIGVDELIYYMFSDRHRKKPDPDRRYDRIYIGGDYGQQNATTFEAFGLDTYRKKFPGLGEYYHSGRESGRQKSPSEYARDLVEFMDELHEQYETGSFIFFWIRLQKVWQKRLEEPPEPDWTIRCFCGMRKMMWRLESAGYRKHWYSISCRSPRSRNTQCRSLEHTSMIRNPSKRGKKCR